jgi:MFS family permease
VTWDGDDDPENPKNWTIGRKWAVSHCEASRHLQTKAFVLISI